jgi:hypothetical protein
VSLIYKYFEYAGLEDEKESERVVVKAYKHEKHLVVPDPHRKWTKPLPWITMVEPLTFTGAAFIIRLCGPSVLRGRGISGFFGADSNQSLWIEGMCSETQMGSSANILVNLIGHLGKSGLEPLSFPGETVIPFTCLRIYSNNCMKETHVYASERHANIPVGIECLCDEMPLYTDVVCECECLFCVSRKDGNTTKFCEILTTIQRIDILAICECGDGNAICHCVCDKCSESRTIALSLPKA